MQSQSVRALASSLKRMALAGTKAPVAEEDNTTTSVSAEVVVGERTALLQGEKAEVVTDDKAEVRF